MMLRDAVCLITFVLLYPIAASGQDATSDPPANADGSANTVNTPNTTVPAPAVPATNYVFPTNRQIVRFGYRGVAGVRTLAGSAVTAWWKTCVTHPPEEWDRNFSGWSKRFGAKVLDNGINQSTLVGLSLVMHQDPIYYRCACIGFWPRTRHAVKSTYQARDRRGDSVFSIPRVTSPFVGPIVTRNTIYPKRFDTWNGIEGGAFYMLGTAGWNMVREFFLKGPQW